MKYSEYREILKRDRNEYGKRSHIRLYIMNSGYKIVVNHRRCKFLRQFKALYFLYMLQRFRYNRLCIKYGCDIPSHVEIGPGFKIDHPVGIIINSRAVIGENVNVKSGVVIGKNSKGVPKIGNNVLIGVHALIIGGVSVGNGASVGAGAIVVHDVPENATVVCEAAHIK